LEDQGCHHEADHGSGGRVRPHQLRGSGLHPAAAAQPTPGHAGAGRPHLRCCRAARLVRRHRGGGPPQKHPQAAGAGPLPRRVLPVADRPRAGAGDRMRDHHRHQRPGGTPASTGWPPPCSTTASTRRPAQDGRDDARPCRRTEQPGYPVTKLAGHADAPPRRPTPTGSPTLSRTPTPTPTQEIHLVRRDIHLMAEVTARSGPLPGRRPRREARRAPLPFRLRPGWPGGPIYAFCVGRSGWPVRGRAAGTYERRDRLPCLQLRTLTRTADVAP
jgi:hypothetical protein